MVPSGSSIRVALPKSRRVRLTKPLSYLAELSGRPVHRQKPKLRSISQTSPRRKPKPAARFPLPQSFRSTRIQESFVSLSLSLFRPRPLEYLTTWWQKETEYYEAINNRYPFVRIHLCILGWKKDREIIKKKIAFIMDDMQYNFLLFSS